MDDDGHDHLSSFPYSSGNPPNATQSIPIYSTVTHRPGHYLATGYIDTSNPLQYPRQWAHQPGSLAGYTGHGQAAPVPTFSQQGYTLIPDQGHPRPYTAPSAQDLPRQPWSYPGPPLARSKSLQHHDAPRFSHEEIYSSALAVLPATSWPGKTTRFGHGPIGSPGSNRLTFTGNLLAGIEDGSFGISPPASSSSHSSHPVTPHDVSLHLPPSPPSSGVTLPFIGLASDEQFTDFVSKSFPDGTPSFEGRRTRLRQVLTSEWKRNNVQEPHKDCLLQFITMNGTKWECLFYVGAERCSCSSTRKIQALEHIRRHIKLEPFVCIGEPCPESQSGCLLRYSSPDPLRKHRKGKTQCEVCGHDVLPGNLRRHLENNCHDT